MKRRIEKSLVQLKPKGWYFLASSTDLRKDKILNFNLLGQEVILFRGERGEAVVTSAKCPHFGSDLSKGSVCKGQLTCPFHGFQFNGKGQCSRAPGEPNIPDYAVLKTYPVREAWGSIFFFYGSKEEATPLPGFPEESLQSQYIISKSFTVDIDAPWFMGGMNEFDTRHFEYVHGREIASPPIHHFDVDGLAYTDLSLNNVGKSFTNRIVRFLFGAKVRLRIHNVFGLIKFAKTEMGPLKNRMMISIVPTGRMTSKAFIRVLIPRPKSIFSYLWIWPYLSLMCYGSKIFFTEETEEIKGALYNSERATEKDKYVTQFMHWLARIHLGDEDGSKVVAPQQYQTFPENSENSTQLR